MEEEFSPTKVVRVSPALDEDTLYKRLAWAADILKHGGLVAIPTETVYGLAGNALDEKAINSIYELKGRPRERPLPLMTTKDRAELYIKKMPEWVRPMVDSFWPGPLSIIFWKSALVPDALTAGSPKVAIRVPSHPITIRLLELVDFPLAVPSANISGRPSPRRAEHVLEDLGGRVDGVLDAGPSPGGVESTIVDVTKVPPVIVRPGSVTVEELSKHLGGQTLKVQETRHRNGRNRHYTPKKAMVYVVACDEEKRLAEKFAELIAFYQGHGKAVGIGASSGVLKLIDRKGLKQFATFDLGSSLSTVAAQIYDALRWADSEGLDIFLVQGFCGGGLARTIMNRLTQAAEGRVVRV